MANPWDFITEEEVVKLQNEGMDENQIRRAAEARMAFAESNPFQMAGPAVSGAQIPQYDFNRETGRGHPQGAALPIDPIGGEIPLRPELARNIPLWQLGGGGPGVRDVGQVAGPLPAGGPVAAEAGAPGQDPLQQKKRGRGLYLIGLGAGQMKSAVASPSSKEMFGAMMTTAGGIVDLAIPADLQNTGWGKVAPIAAIIGTAMNIRGRRESAKKRISYKARIVNQVGKALRKLRNF